MLLDSRSTSDMPSTSDVRPTARLCRVIHAMSRDWPFQPLSPSPPHPHPHPHYTNHTQILHSIASVITAITPARLPSCRPHCAISSPPSASVAHHRPHCRPTVNHSAPSPAPFTLLPAVRSRILAAAPAPCWERLLYRRHEQSYRESRSIAPSLSTPSLCSLPTLGPWFTLALSKPPLLHC
jgi:hypothetical protein